MTDGRISRRIVDLITENAQDDAVRAFLLEILYKEADGLHWWKETYSRAIDQYSGQGEVEDED